MSRRPVVPMTPRLQAMLEAQQASQTPTRIPLSPQALSRADGNHDKAATAKEDDQAEAELQEDVLAYLRSAKGIQQLDVDHSRRGLPAGVPDIRFAYRGRAIFLELKTRTGRTTEAQDQDHERRIMDGWAGGVFRSIPEIKSFLDQLETQGADR